MESKRCTVSTEDSFGGAARPPKESEREVAQHLKEIRRRIEAGYVIYNSEARLLLRALDEKEVVSGS